ncbi:MAG: hypothetical protein ACXITV_02655 [Luteibaculaceae bacterium]
MAEPRGSALLCLLIHAPQRLGHPWGRLLNLMQLQIILEAQLGSAVKNKLGFFF